MVRHKIAKILNIMGLALGRLSSRSKILKDFPHTARFLDVYTDF